MFGHPALYYALLKHTLNIMFFVGNVINLASLFQELHTYSNRCVGIFYWSRFYFLYILYFLYYIFI